MIRRLAFTTLLMLAVGLIAAGCGSLLTNPATPQQIALAPNIISTNDTQAVAIAKLAQDLNESLNFTSTRQPVNLLLASGVTLLAALGGWLARHKSNPPASP